ncbi:single-stranded DNA-binding protein [Cellulosilyticum sp. I15G10I2]|uniref:single-stranded DNA-binding protein n=1 Tax=Cellulosilyticum sp. I15G10I2 TaxID=1892843 RepID=UPI00085CDECD|nr:single-stranded DNA-binding protein [Cellulosilyticum sp. I15G10I2]
MNKVILMGRLTRDPEVRYSQSATPVAVARYGLAVRRQFARQGEQDVDFFNIVSFGKAGEFAEKFFRKGQMVSIVGRLQVNTWEDQQKVKHTSVDVVAEEQHFAESRTSSESRGVMVDSPISSPGTAPSSGNSVEGFMPTQIEEDDDLPF